MEHAYYGTNTFLRWYLCEYLEQTHIQNFVQHLVKSGVLRRKRVKKLFLSNYGKNPMHAILLCGHRKTITILKAKPEFPDLLNEHDSHKRTALHIAAINGDMVSVRILTKWYIISCCEAYYLCVYQFLFLVITN